MSKIRKREDYEKKKIKNSRAAVYVDFLKIIYKNFCKKNIKYLFPENIQLLSAHYLIIFSNFIST